MFNLSVRRSKLGINLLDLSLYQSILIVELVVLVCNQ